MSAGVTNVDVRRQRHLLQRNVLVQVQLLDAHHDAIGNRHRRALDFDLVQLMADHATFFRARGFPLQLERHGDLHLLLFAYARQVQVQTDRCRSNPIG